MIDSVIPDKIIIECLQGEVVVKLMVEWNDRFEVSSVLFCNPSGTIHTDVIRIKTEVLDDDARIIPLIGVVPTLILDLKNFPNFERAKLSGMRLELCFLG